MKKLTGKYFKWAVLLLVCVSAGARGQLQLGGPSVAGGSGSTANFLYKRYSLDVNTALFNTSFNGDPSVYSAWLLVGAHTVGSPYFNKALSVCAYRTPSYTYAIMNGYTNNGLIYQSHGLVSNGVMTRFEYLVVCSD